MKQNSLLLNVTRLTSIFFACFLYSVSLHAQCNFAQMKATKKDALCSNDGSITLTVPGACNTSVNLRKVGDNAFFLTNTLTASGANSTVTFSNLAPGDYNVFYMDGSIERPFTGNPVKILYVYKDMALTATNTSSSCADMDDGTLTITVTAGTGTGPFVYSMTTARGTVTSDPTAARSYIFGDNYTGGGVITGETVSYTVTDKKNGVCEYSVTQTRNITSTSSLFTYTNLSSVYFEETNTCDEFQSTFNLYAVNFSNSQSARKLHEFLQLPGNAVVTVTPADGSAAYTQNLTLDPRSAVRENALKNRKSINAKKQL